ncbi:hypothetical protein FN846DRAFT_656681 [Sphaerosporella brunnea]|uniref:Secreted protein n=1 Tax=Sphaerosporella brunnea TaxID=1250544 RepID=A0A5J5EBH2_9PEZI|nr:hypothetical protein FN846DRAFT_656681 [Sphaerosporella brunnea]
MRSVLHCLLRFAFLPSFLPNLQTQCLHELLPRRRCQNLLSTLLHSIKKSFSLCSCSSLDGSLRTLQCFSCLFRLILSPPHHHVARLLGIQNAATLKMRTLGSLAPNLFCFFGRLNLCSCFSTSVCLRQPSSQCSVKSTLQTWCRSFKVTDFVVNRLGLTLQRPHKVLGPLSASYSVRADRFWLVDRSIELEVVVLEG